MLGVRFAGVLIILALLFPVYISAAWFVETSKYMSLEQRGKRNSGRLAETGAGSPLDTAGVAACDHPPDAEDSA